MDYIDILNLGIGETFESDDRTFKVSEGLKGCKGCSMLTNIPNSCIMHRRPVCVGSCRSDKIDVIFEEVK